MSQEHLTQEQKEAAAILTIRNQLNRVLSDFLKQGDLASLYEITVPGVHEPLNRNIYSRYLPLLTVFDSGLPSGEGFLAKNLTESGNVYTDGCFILTGILYKVLSYFKIEMEIRLSRMPGKLAPVHEYGAFTQDGIEIIVDPSIGQIVGGHAKIFIGTKEQLRQLIQAAYRDGKLVNLAHFREEKEMFETDSPTADEVLEAFWNI